MIKTTCLKTPLLRFFTLLGISFSNTVLQPADAQADSKTPSRSSEILTFPSMVTPQRLKSISKPDLHKSAYQLVFSTLSQSKPKQPTHIQIASTGNLQLTLKSGTHFALLDADGRDGQATVQLPNGIYQGYLEIQQLLINPETAKLQYTDPLYYVEQTLNKGWWDLGKRPLPVPSNWHSDHGQNLVLNLNHQGITNFKMHWVHTPERQAELPLGIKEIGPSGGTIELPGVAKLEIPAGALSSKQIVKISQVEQAPSRSHPPPFENDYSFNSSSIGQDYISPLIKIEPFGLHLNKEAHITLKSDIEIELENTYGEGVFLILNKLDINHQNYFKSTKELDALSFLYGRKVKISEPIRIKTFGYLAKLKLHGYDL